MNSPSFRDKLQYRESIKTIHFSRKGSVPTGTKLFEDFFDGIAQQQSEKEIDSDYHIQLAMYAIVLNPWCNLNYRCQKLKQEFTKDLKYKKKKSEKIN
jgi:hypothetical protein